MFNLIEISKSLTITEFDTFEKAQKALHEKAGVKNAIVNDTKTMYTVHTHDSENTTFIIVNTDATNIVKFVPGSKLDMNFTNAPYSGIDIEYIAENEDKTAYHPRIVIEKPEDTKELAAIIWERYSEDSSRKILLDY